MRKIMTLALGLNLAAASLAAGEAFEGVVDMALSGPHAEAQTIQYSAKGAKLRMDMEGQGGHKMVMLIDNATQKRFMLMPEKKVALSMDLKAADARRKDSAQAKLTKTGKTEQILGYTAEQFLVEEGGGKGSMEIWAAKGLGTFHMAPQGGPMGAKQAPHAWEKEFRDKGYFPLKVVGKSFSMQVTKIVKKGLDDSLFEVPADYKLMDLGAMMGGGGAWHGP